MECNSCVEQDINGLLASDSESEDAGDKDEMHEIEVD